jgi:predicted lipoprotein with Yx(FWY)xxD motif
VKRSHSSIVLIAVATGLVVAGCGSSSNSGSTSGKAASSNSASGNSSSGAGYGYGGGQSTSSSSSSSGAAAPVSVGNASGVGPVLVDSTGMTLYYFEKDQKGSGQSKCEGPCAQAWPPLTTGGQPKAMSGVNASMLGTIKRSDGSMQVTYAGWPLYTFIEDKAPGQDNGTDSKAFGASWYPLHPNGEKAGD